MKSWVDRALSHHREDASGVLALERLKDGADARGDLDGDWLAAGAPLAHHLNRAGVPIHLVPFQRVGIRLAFADGARELDERPEIRAHLEDGGHPIAATPMAERMSITRC
jgi:hypothetical protein